MQEQPQNLQSPQKKRIKLSKASLFCILVLFQIFSLKTTVEGARIVLSSLKPYSLPFGFQLEASVVLGVGVQLFLLWLFTLGKEEIKSALRFWILALIFTSASIYTSFFSFYKDFSQGKLEENYLADDKHTKLVSILSPILSSEFKRYTNIMEELDRTKKNIRDAEERRKRQTKDGKGANLVDEIERFKKDLKNLEKEEKEFPDRDFYYPLVQKKITEKLEFKTKSISAKEIFDNDKDLIYAANHAKKHCSNPNNKQICSVFDYKNYNEEEFTKNDYLGKNSYLFVPAEQVLKGDSNAIVALMIASIVDITSLILGTIVKGREKQVNVKEFKAGITNFFKNLFKILKDFLPHLFEETAQIIFNLITSLASIINAFLFGLIIAKKRSLQVFVDSYKKIKIRGRREDFLHYLLKSLEELDSINYKKLMSFSQNESFTIGYNRLINAMIDNKWIKKEKEFSYKIEDYEAFYDWYQREEAKNFDSEKHSMLLPNDYYTLIDLPKKKPSGEEQKQVIRIPRKISFWLNQLF